MARINNLSNFLTDVATAIKNKKGSQTAIPAANFDTEISNLPSQGVYQHKQVTVVDNGSVTVLPDTGYDAIDQLDLTVNIPLQQKTYTFTQNTTTTIIPEQGYAGFSQVGLEINVPSSQPNLQDKTVTQNGVYTADSGYDGLDTVTVNVSGGEVPVKLFATEQAMQADPNPSEGDLALVYSATPTPYGEESVTRLYLPPQVVFSTPYTSESTTYVECGSQCGISATQFYYQVSSDWSSENFFDFQCTYTSEDGIIYNRGEFNGYGVELVNDIVELPEAITISYDGMGTDNRERAEIYAPMIFMDYNVYFGGLYKYTLNVQTKNIKIRDLTSATITITDGSAGSFSVPNFINNLAYNVDDLQAVLDTNKTLLGDRYGVSKFYIDTNDNLKLVTCNGDRFVVNTAGNIIGLGGFYNVDSVKTYTVDLTTKTLSNETIYNTNTWSPSQYTTYRYWLISDFKSLLFYPTVGVNQYMAIIVENTSMNEWCEQLDPYIYENKYLNAPTQLTANINDVLTDKILYGKSGLITGDGSIYDTLLLENIIAYKSTTPIMSNGIYIKTGEYNINTDSLLMKTNSGEISTLSSSVGIVQNYAIPQAYQHLFESEAYSSNNGIHTSYDQGYVIKINKTSYSTSLLYVFSADLQTVLVDGYAIAKGVDRAVVEGDIIYLYAYGYTGKYNLTNHTYTVVSTAPSQRHSYGRCAYIGNDEYSATQTAVYKNGTKVYTISMPTSSGSWGYTCSVATYNNVNYLVIFQISQSSSTADRKMCSINLATNAITYTDLANIITSTGSYVEIIRNYTSDGYVYFHHGNTLYRTNGITIESVISGLTGGYTQSTADNTGYIETAFIYEDSHLNKKFIVSALAGKLMDFTGTEYNLLAFGAKLCDFWSSSDPARTMVDINTLESYYYTTMTDGIIQITHSNSTYTSGVNSNYLICPTGTDNLSMVIPNDITKLDVTVDIIEEV